MIIDDNIELSALVLVELWLSRDDRRANRDSFTHLFFGSPSWCFSSLFLSWTFAEILGILVVIVWTVALENEWTQARQWWVGRCDELLTELTLGGMLLVGKDEIGCFTDRMMVTRCVQLDGCSTSHYWSSTICTCMSQRSNHENRATLCSLPITPKKTG